MVSYVTPWLLLLSVPMLVIAGIKRRKWLAILLAAATLANLLTFAPLFLPPPRVSVQPDALSLKIMSYNLHKIPETEGIIEVIRREKPDILLLQEYSPKLQPPLPDGLKSIYPELYFEVDTNGFGQAIFSRYPLRQTSVSFDSGRTQKVEVQTPSGPIAVWNAHPVPPFLVPPEIYDAQINVLAGEIAKATEPLIVGGDFNATDQSEAYRKINRRLADSYREAGWGFGFSFPAPPYTFMDLPFQTGPLWRIDFIFHSTEFIVTSARTLKTSGGSDHFPILVEISIAR